MPTRYSNRRQNAQTIQQFDTNTITGNRLHTIILDDRYNVTPLWNPAFGLVNALDAFIPAYAEKQTNELLPPALLTWAQRTIAGSIAPRWRDLRLALAGEKAAFTKDEAALSTPPARDHSDAAGELRDAEIRSMVRSMGASEQISFLLGAPVEVVAAVLRAGRDLSGITSDENWQRLRDHYRDASIRERMQRNYENQRAKPTLENLVPTAVDPEFLEAAVAAEIQKHDLRPGVMSVAENLLRSAVSLTAETTTEGDERTAFDVLIGTP